MNTNLIIPIFLILTMCSVAVSISAGQDDAGRPGVIQLSNGESLEGDISVTPGSQLRIQAGDDLKDVSFSAVQEMRFIPEKETMEQKWRFVEAGRTEKKKWGELYPVREIGAQLCLGGGRTLTGHLYTTVLYIAQSNQTQKLVVKAKDKGREGQTLKDVVYPVSVTFADAAESLPGDVRVDTGGRKNVKFVVLAENSLLRLAARPEKAGPVLLLPALTASNVFAAVESGDELRAGWPAQSDAGLTARIEKALVDVEDFFDARKVLGVWQSGEETYSLLMLHRKGATTLGAEKSQPWRLEVWRWKEAEGKLMLAARGYFFRGILDKQSGPPPVKLDPQLWRMELKDTVKLP